MFHFLIELTLTLLAVAIALTQCVFGASNSIPIRIVASQGEGAPNTSPEVVFNIFERARINNSGQVAFYATLSGESTNRNNNGGIFREGSDGISLVARFGDAAPETEPGVIFSTVGIPVFNDLSQSAFDSILYGPGVSDLNSRAIYSEGGGNGVELIARTGDFAPGTGEGVKFASFPSLMFLNNRGSVAFVAGLTGNGVGPTNNTAIYRADSHGIRLVARAGDRFSEAEPELMFRSLSYPVLNDNDQIAFFGSLIGSGASPSFGQAIFRDNPVTGLETVVRIGDSVPGMDVGVIFAGLDVEGSDEPALNNRGEMAFGARIGGPGISGSNDRVILSEGGGRGLKVVAREGTVAPGADDSVTFSTFEPPVLNARGESAFIARLAGNTVETLNRVALFSEGMGKGLKLVARSGDVVPGSTDLTISSFEQPFLNAKGQTAFFSTISGPGITSSRNEAVFAEDTAGNLHLIAREGGTINVSNDPSQPDFRTIIQLGFNYTNWGSGNEDGRESIFNDSGLLVFSALFDDSTTAILVANLVAVPEPSSVALLAIAIVTMSRYFCRITRIAAAANALTGEQKLCVHARRQSQSQKFGLVLQLADIQGRLHNDCQAFSATVRPTMEPPHVYSACDARPALEILPVV